MFLDSERSAFAWNALAAIRGGMRRFAVGLHTAAARVRACRFLLIKAPHGLEMESRTGSQAGGRGPPHLLVYRKKTALASLFLSAPRFFAPFSLPKRVFFALLLHIVYSIPCKEVVER